ncbi:MAG TPA: glycosyltransferase [Lacibacter sp.]|nr:glycosyltransferase [Lacibacter sp.]HMO89978.1 glycosyltransferase [Lacibacter sp.]
MKFSAFIITYKRPETAATTIRALFQQTRPPDEVVVIDNDPAQSASVLENIDGLPVRYVPVGSNSGAAGGAAKGLQVLAATGYDWISWIDDDDPPIFKDVYERLLHLATTQPACGCVGIIGQQFDRRNGIITRFPDAAINGTGALEVDTIAGGMIKIVNGGMVREHKVYPDDRMFFGFEDLDVDLQIRKAGYHLYVDKELFLRHRKHYNRMNLEVQRSVQKPKERLWREYYSIRSLLAILRKHGLDAAFFSTLLRAVYKVFYNYRFGFVYGNKNAGYMVRGILDFMLGKYGKRV